MRRLILALALLLFAQPLSAQTALCPAEYTATGAGYYRVVVDGASVSQHTRLDQAIERANAEETQAPASAVTVVHDYELRIECDEDWTVPTGTVTDTVMLTVTDTLVVTDTVTVQVTDTVTVTADPDRVTTLTVLDSTATSFRIAWLQVDDGTGEPADYEVRVREVGDTTSWLHPALVVLGGSCGFPVLGDEIGGDVVCEITGLDEATDYQALVRAFRDVDP